MRKSHRIAEIGLAALLACLIGTAAAQQRGNSRVDSTGPDETADSTTTSLDPNDPAFISPATLANQNDRVAPPAATGNVEPPPGSLQAELRRVGAAWTSGVAWLLLTLLCILVANRQRVEAGGRLFRQTWVSAFAAAIALAPLFTWLCLQLMEKTAGPGFELAVCLTIFSALWTARWLRRPLRADKRQRMLPLVDDAPFLARVAQIAAAMRIRPPRVRLLRTVGGSLRVLAWAGGLPQPSVVITDGLLHRLTPAERDAIVAHEMGHIANHSMWPLMAVVPLSCTAAVMVDVAHPVEFALLFGIAFCVGLRRVVSRPIEADCDRRAGQAIGFTEMISALEKVYAAHPLRSTGLIPLLAHAVSTHPSPQVRLSLLHRAAERDRASVDRPANSGGETPIPRSRAFQYSTARFWTHRIVSIVALLLWLAALAIAPPLARQDSGYATPLLMTVILAPTFLLLFSKTAEAKRQAKRQRLRFRLITRILLCLFVAFFADVLCLSAIKPESDWLVIGWASSIAVLGLLLVLSIFIFFLQAYSPRSRRVKKLFLVALQEHDFARALAIGRSNAKAAAKDPLLRYNIALIEAIAGDRERGVAELEDLVVRHPTFALPRIALGEFYLDSGNADRALEIAEAAAAKSPRDPAMHGTAARALRRLGRLDEAQAAGDRAWQLDPELGDSHAMAAALALDRGDFVAAERFLGQSLKLAPGDPFCLTIQAELAVATGPKEHARLVVEQAIGAIRKNPFMILNTELAWLQQQLQKLSDDQVSQAI